MFQVFSADNSLLKQNPTLLRIPAPTHRQLLQYRRPGSNNLHRIRIFICIWRVFATINIVRQNRDRRSSKNALLLFTVTAGSKAKVVMLEGYPAIISFARPSPLCSFLRALPHSKSVSSSSSEAARRRLDRRTTVFPSAHLSARHRKLARVHTCANLTAQRSTVTPVSPSRSRSRFRNPLSRWGESTCAA